ncbi:MAG: hypothetical protein M9962_02220 [Oligoflexia bacterium]|nr:hypothetical protein [Oligoflexia bacterium]
MTLLKLLEDKNTWYKKYLQCTEAFHQALMHAPDIAIEEIDLFLRNRDSLLMIIENIDEKIQTLLERDPSTEQNLNSHIITKINSYIREKDSIIKSVLEVDSKVQKEIELIQEKGLKQLSTLNKSKKAISSYKSQDGGREKINKRV